MTLAHVEQCSEATARKLTDQLRQSLVISWELLVEAYQRRAWAALGYESWDSYTDAELGETRLRLPREERREVVASMTEAGMSTRAIGSALGISREQVRRDTKVPPEREPIDAEIVDDVDQAAMAHHDRLMGHDLPLDQRAERARVLGTDGKSYPAEPKQMAQRRRPLPDAFTDAALDLMKAIERVERLVADDRFPQNADQVATRHRSDLIRAIDALQDVSNRLPSA